MRFFVHANIWSHPDDVHILVSPKHYQRAVEFVTHMKNQGHHDDTSSLIPTAVELQEALLSDGSPPLEYSRLHLTQIPLQIQERIEAEFATGIPRD